MEFERVITIAEKEFADTLRGKKFLLIFGIYLIVAFVGAVQGIWSYTSGSSFLGIPPTILDVFQRMGATVSTFGAVLGIAAGFDLISGEREEGSLKVLLARPVFRDEIITGKVLGGAMTLALATGLSLAITLGLLLLTGHLPRLLEFWLILVFGAVSFLYLFGCFGIGLAMSAVSRRSGEALLFALAAFFLLSLAVPTAGTAVADLVVGETPEVPQIIDEKDMDIWYAYKEESQRHHDLRESIVQAAELFSPEWNYDEAMRAITKPHLYLLMRGPADGDRDAYSFDAEPDPGEILSHLWTSIVALLLVPVLFLGFAYAKFLRLDLR
ncbi:ABC transporter permease [Methanoculleus sp. 7T]|uniref:ABC transporter permease n=1 Tax=Methanoculleus sp. 7T TaxID=2937282 RepID=UPI0020C00524|nr:ABC transporter permease [Methanoculleus sp. 7T]MCK8518080.1 ABC transporter permease [Methanoculleus sp. 7T]